MIGISISYWAVLSSKILIILIKTWMKHSGPSPLNTGRHLQLDSNWSSYQEPLQAQRDTAMEQQQSKSGECTKFVQKDLK